MRKMFAIALGVCAVAGLALVTSTSADAKCRKASAMGLGIGPEMAKEMAKMNVDAAIKAKGKTARGRTTYACSGPFECTATRRSC